MKQELFLAPTNSSEDDKVPHVLKLKGKEIFNGKYMHTYNMMLSLGAGGKKGKKSKRL